MTEEKMNGWYDIKVTPPKDDPFKGILITDGLNIYIGYRNGDKITQVFVGEYGFQSNVYRNHTNITHWMPLPILPDPEYYDKTLAELKEDSHRIFFPDDFKKKNQ